MIYKFSPIPFGTNSSYWYSQGGYEGGDVTRTLFDMAILRAVKATVRLLLQFWHFPPDLNSRGEMPVCFLKM